MSGPVSVEFLRGLLGHKPAGNDRGGRGSVARGSARGSVRGGRGRRGGRGGVQKSHVRISLCNIDTTTLP